MITVEQMRVKTKIQVHSLQPTRVEPLNKGHLGISLLPSVEHFLEVITEKGSRRAYYCVS